MNLEPYILISNAIVKLFSPLAEVVIHNLESNKVEYISGVLSKREIGDASNMDLSALLDEVGISEVTYPKLNFDGRLIKSISVPLEEGEEMKYLLCINCDVSLFEQLKKLANVLLPETTEQPVSLFKNDWQERFNKAVHAYLKEKDWAFKGLNTAQKKELVHHLFKQGAFNEKNAADYAAKTLRMGRATIFNYLKTWRTNK